MKPAKKVSTIEYALGIVILASVIVGAIAFDIWLDPPPNPNEPKCLAGEIAIPAQRQWWCVQARKP